MPDRRLGKLALEAIRGVSGPKLGPVPSSSRGQRSNVDRLVALAKELLATFGAGGFASMAETEIRNRTNEASAARALERIHKASEPPYR